MSGPFPRTSVHTSAATSRPIPIIPIGRSATQSDRAFDCRFPTLCVCRFDCRSLSPCDCQFDSRCVTTVHAAASQLLRCNCS